MANKASQHSESWASERGRERHDGGLIQLCLDKVSDKEEQWMHPSKGDSPFERKGDNAASLQL